MTMIRTKRLAMPLAVLAIASLLASCTVSDGGGPDPFSGRDLEPAPEGEYTENVDPIRFELGGFEDRTFRFDLDSTSASGAMFAINLGDLVVETTGGSAIASSSTGIYFASGRGGLESTSSLLAPESLPPGGTRMVCDGPCVILKRAEEPRSVVVEVSNPFSGPRDVELYAFGMELDDRAEPRNDSIGGAEVLDLESGSAFVTGALETIRDTDFYRIDPDADLSSVSVTIDGTNTGESAYVPDLVTLRAAVVDDEGRPLDPTFVGPNPVEIDPGDFHTFDNVVPGDYLRIEVVGNRAAASEFSAYNVSVE